MSRLIGMSAVAGVAEFLSAGHIERSKCSEVCGASEIAEK